MIDNRQNEEAYFLEKQDTNLAEEGLDENRNINDEQRVMVNNAVDNERINYYDQGVIVNNGHGPIINRRAPENRSSGCNWSTWRWIVSAIIIIVVAIIIIVHFTRAGSGSTATSMPTSSPTTNGPCGAANETCCPNGFYECNSDTWMNCNEDTMICNDPCGDQDQSFCLHSPICKPGLHITSLLVCGLI